MIAVKGCRGGRQAGMQAGRQTGISVNAWRLAELERAAGMDMMNAMKSQQRFRCNSCPRLNKEAVC